MITPRAFLTKKNSKKKKTRKLTRVNIALHAYPLVNLGFGGTPLNRAFWFSLSFPLFVWKRKKQHIESEEKNYLAFLFPSYTSTLVTLFSQSTLFLSPKPLILGGEFCSTLAQIVLIFHFQVGLYVFRTQDFSIWYQSGEFIWCIFKNFFFVLLEYVMFLLLLFFLWFNFYWREDRVKIWPFGL